jgi:predicted metal-binding membrane protein
MTTAAVSYPLTRERNLILATLLALAGIAWAVLIWQASMMDEDDMGLTMGMGAPLFIALWIAMMVAIMFPTAAPMILNFARVQANRQAQGRTFVPIWLFTGSYIALWAATGLAAYAGAALADRLADDSMWLMENAARIGGGLLVVAGLYQLSPLKTVCLSRCRTPMSFVLNFWRDGRAGAIQMGLRHGAYCLGCCWLLFAILFPLGMMNIAAMAAITALIFAEKSFPIGLGVSRIAAVAFVLYGAVVIAIPDALPTMM